MKTFEDEHVRILRECAAYVANNANQPTQRGLKLRALEALRQFAVGVAPYCTHPDKVNSSGAKQCLSCGKVIIDEDAA